MSCSTCSRDVVTSTRSSLSSSPSSSYIISCCCVVLHSERTVCSSHTLCLSSIGSGSVCRRCPVSSCRSLTGGLTCGVLVGSDSTLCLSGSCSRSYIVSDRSSSLSSSSSRYYIITSRGRSTWGVSSRRITTSRTSRRLGNGYCRRLSTVSSFIEGKDSPVGRGAWCLSSDIESRHCTEIASVLRCILIYTVSNRSSGSAPVESECRCRDRSRSESSWCRWYEYTASAVETISRITTESTTASICTHTPCFSSRCRIGWLRVRRI